MWGRAPSHTPPGCEQAEQRQRMTDEAQRERERLLSERQARQERRARELDECARAAGVG